MIALILSPIFFSLLIWIGYRLHKLVDYLKIENKKLASFIKWLAILQFVFTAFIVIGFLNNSRFFNVVGSYWLGISFYLILGSIISFVVAYIYKKNKKDNVNEGHIRYVSFIFIIIFTLAFSIYGVINARIIRTTNYEVSIDKDTKNINDLKIALIADTHFGYNIDDFHLKQAVDIINENNVDLVVIAGDIFDNDYNAIENPNKLIDLFKTINSKYGIYAVLGNHDIEEDILCGFTFNNGEIKNASKEMIEFLDKANINLLYDEYTLIDNSFYIYGRPDYKNTNFNHEPYDRVSANEIIKDMDLSKPVIVIDHQPREFDELEKAGVDLDLSGHTHDGQIWPSKYLVNFIFKNPYGYYKQGSFNSITTSGLGLFGPNMRTFTIPEVAIINVKFN